MKQLCYTIGHSNYSLGKFISLLKRHDITHLVDVRSVPYSKYANQFNEKPLKAQVQLNGIKYIYMGKELGARFDTNKYKDESGRLDFSGIIRRNQFTDGISRVIRGITSGAVIAIMCSEKEPFDCHRFILISFALQQEGIVVTHILEGGSLIDNSELENRLINKYCPEYVQMNLFSPNLSHEEALLKSYEQKYQEIAYNVAEKEE